MAEHAFGIRAVAAEARLVLAGLACQFRERADRPPGARTLTMLAEGTSDGDGWSDVELDRAAIRIRASLQDVDGELRLVPPKTARSRRTVMLPATAVSLLRVHRRGQLERRMRLGEAWRGSEDFVCDDGLGGPINPNNLSHAFGGIATRASADGVRLHDATSTPRNASSRAFTRRS